MSFGKLLLDAKKQYIDENGKTRILFFDNVRLIISPLPSLELEEEKDIKNINSKLDDALAFLEKYHFKISYQDGNKEDGIQGLWLDVENLSIYYAYLPLKISNALPNVPFSDPMKIDPIRTGGRSILSDFRKSKKVADFLKVYVLYTYAKIGDLDENSFVIKPKHNYDLDILQKRLFIDGNDVMYEKGKLIVQSAEIARNLLSYLNVQKLNNKQNIENLLKISTIEENYQGIADFRTKPNQLVFTSAGGFLRWKRDHDKIKKMNEIKQYLISDTLEPYFYKNLEILNDRLCIIQNVKDGSLEAALTVSYKWEKDKVNIGFDTNSLKDIKKTASYSIYSEFGLVQEKKGKLNMKVIIYENGMYAALLPL